jgi:probable HAF family extracellular repeat protein
LTLAVIVGAGAQQVAADAFTITDLGPADAVSKAFGINASGQVGGVSGTDGVVWSGGSMTPVGTLSGGTAYNHGSWVNALNDSGRWVGRADTDGADFHAAAADDAGVIQDLNDAITNSTAWTLRNAWDINNGDIVVGEGDLDVGGGVLVRRGYRLDLNTGHISDLGPSPTNDRSYAHAVNENWSIVGDGGTVGHSWIMNLGSPMVDLSGATGPWSMAYDINDNGQVAGYVDTGWGNYEAFKVSPGYADDGDQDPDYWFADANANNHNDYMKELGALDGQNHSIAYGINNDGHTVGWSTHADSLDLNDRHAFLCKQLTYAGAGGTTVTTTEVMYDLNDFLPAGSGWELLEARDINDAGQIVGFGTYGPLGLNHAFLLTPVSADFDDDGDVDTDDIDILCNHLGDSAYDLDGDGDADEDDMVFLIENLVELTDGSGRIGTQVGDFNLDGLINATDLAIMNPNFGLGAMLYGNGNGNCDDLINATDLAILAANFGYAAPTGTVPEPTTMGLLALGGLALLKRRQK